jgi:hypothetical protein
MSKIGKYVGIAVVVVGVLGAGFLVVAPAAAQTVDPVLPGGGPGNGYGSQGANGLGVNDATQEALAEVLGISVEELQAAFDAASEPGDVPAALGISQEEFQAAVQEVMQADRGTGNQWAVEYNGTATWGQANRMLQSGTGTCIGTGIGIGNGGSRLFGGPTGN